jgi:PAS domain S-box-containing protein
MKHMTKTKAQLLNEVARLRKRVAKLETANAKRTINKNASKQTKTALLHSDELYYLFFNNINDAIFIYEGPMFGGMPGRFLEVNSVACKRLGYTREELLQKSPSDIDAPDTIPQVPEMMKKLVEKKFAVWEGAHLTKDGRRIPVEISNHLFKLDGKPTILSAVKDITIRKRAEESNKRAQQALRESEQRFRTLSEATFEGISLTENGVIVDLNDQHAKMHGYKRSELIGKHVLELVAPESRERLVESIRMGELGPIEYLDLRKDGKKLFVEVRSSVVRIGGRELVISAVRDITKRKQSEEALQHERNLLRVLIDNLPDLFYYKDAKGRYILNNPAHLRSIGAKCQEDVVGKTTFDYHPRGLAEKYFADEMKVVQSGEAMIRKEELCFRKDTGKMHWHLTSKIPVKDSKGNVTGFVCISHDITEQKRVQEAFEHERNLLRTLIDTMPELINYKDLEGRYLLNNLAHLRSLGVKHQEDALGKTMFDFHAADMANKYYESELQVIRSGEPVLDKEEVVVHHDTGEKRWHLTSKVPLKDNQGKVASYITISRDITDRKHYEETLQHERNLLRTVIDNLPDLIFYKDTEGRYILDNLPHMQSIGAERQEDVVGKTTFDFNPPDLAKLYMEDESKVIQSGLTMQDREEIALHRDTGERRWHLTTRVPLIDKQGKVTGLVGIARDITERKRAEAERERLIKELQDAFADIKTLSGLVPICANCKKIRDDKGFWTQVESYIQERSQARFSHGICPDCMKKLYPEFIPPKDGEGY